VSEAVAVVADIHANLPALEHTDQHAKDLMRELPFDLRIDVGDRAVHLVHGSPRKVNEYLFEDKPASLYERLAAAEEADTLVRSPPPACRRNTPTSSSPPPTTASGAFRRSRGPCPPARAA